MSQALIELNQQYYRGRLPASGGFLFLTGETFSDSDPLFDVKVTFPIAEMTKFVRKWFGLWKDKEIFT